MKTEISKAQSRDQLQHSGAPTSQSFKNSSYRGTLAPKGLLASLVILCAMLNTVSAQDQVFLNSAQASLNSAKVYQTTDFTLEMLRRNSGPVWAPNHCFQLFVGSPYSDSTIYSTFWQSQPPVCESLTAGVVVGSCTVQASDTLNIIFSQVGDLAKSNQSIRIKITNFHTPFSSQILRTLNIRSFSDAICSAGMRTVSMPSITVQQIVLPTANVEFTSSSNVLGASTSGNTLIVKFTPTTTMNPGGSGIIQIGVPFWYEIGNTGERSYNPTAQNKCTSSCMRITSAGLQGAAIEIKYETMVEECISGTQITISCRQFYNPIVPQKTTGFSVTIYDNEVDQRIIEQTEGNVYLDASNFTPAIIPVNNFIIDPSNSMIATFSTWTMSLTVNIPMQTKCYIRFYIPPEFVYDPQEMEASGIFVKADLNSSIHISDLGVIYRTTDGKIPKSSVVFEGCNVDSALGKTPFGRIDITSIQSQSAMKDSETFEIQIFKDKEMTMLIAQLADGAILPAANLEPGTLSNMKISPSDYRVQRVTDLTVSFTTSHALNGEANVILRLPTGLSVKDGASTLTVTMSDASTQTATVLPGNEIRIPNLVAAGQTLPAGSTAIFVIAGIKNQNSAKDAGDFQITTQNKIGNDFYIVDQDTSETSFVALTGKIDTIGAIVVDNPTNSAVEAVYTLKFTLEDALPKSGYVQIDMPPEVVLSPSSTQSTGSCRDYTCWEVTGSSIKFLIQNGLPASQENVLKIGGVTNPRSLKPSGEFLMTTLDIDGVAKIDDGFRISVTMTQAGAIESFEALPTSLVNGAVNQYTFSTQAIIPVLVGDKISMTLPDEMGAPSNSAAMKCESISNIIKMDCTVVGKTMTFVLNDITRATDAFRWTVSGIRNAPSTKPSPFSSVNFLDSQGYVVSSVASDTTVTNREPAELTSFSINQDVLTHSAPAKFTIVFTPINPMPATGSVQVTYPSQVTMIDGANTACTVTTTSGTFPTNCKVTPASLQITVTGIFASNPGYKGPITITVLNVKNPETNKPGNGFVIQTYQDNNQNFIQDKLGDFILQPQFNCVYPCADCSGASKGTCSACWQGIDDPNFLMFYPNGTQTCRPYCEANYTTNGHANKHCEACDISCDSCNNNQQVGDKFKCAQCAVTHSFRLSQTQTCLAECELGQFASTNNTCALCKSPCKGCTGTDATCTQCFQQSAVPNLFFDKCIDVCPVGYVSMSGICTKCISPCATCSDRPETCDTCEYGTKFKYQQRCYDECPRGTGADAEKGTCFPCELGCDLCDIQNKTECLKCTAPTVAYQGGCLAECPEGWHINNPPSDGRACRPWKLGDEGTLFFPFLITAAIFTCIILFGLMKKRAYLSHGKMAMWAPQNTITCIIVAIAPLQFLATITQAILSIFYPVDTFAILAGVVILMAIVINFAFQIHFFKWFDSNRIPAEIDRRVRLGKMTKKEAAKHLAPVDNQFSVFKRQNKTTTYVVYALTVTMNFKFNKMFYSFFYDLKMFQANITNAKYYRKMMTWYQIIYLICIDLCLICIDITCLTKIEGGLNSIDGNNQLWITVVETLILSILSFVLGAIELWLLKRSLAYTEPKRNKLKLKNSQIESDSWENDDDLDKKFDKGKMTERRLLMDDLLKHVKHNKQLFLNNKLDELLNAFGDRKCKSMLDLGTGWQLEDDPRMAVTWPCSPALRDEYNEMGEVRFTDEDKYGAQGNNVYADVKSKFMGMDFGTQDDAGFLEFQDALNRKHGGLMSQQEGDLEERRMKRKNRRRGRKNKYYAQIDHEDDQEAQVAEASDQDEQLQVIKEQEEEEENLRKAVQLEAKKQQDATQARKKQLEEANAAKQAQEMMDADLRKKKAYDLEQASKAEQVLEIERARQQVLVSKKIQEEHAQERVKAAADEKKRAEEARDASTKARAEYDQQDKERLAKEKEELARVKAEDEIRQKQKNTADLVDKQRVIDEKKKAEALRDAQDLAEQKDKIRKEDESRAEERKKAKVLKETQKAQDADLLSPQLTEMNQTIKMADTLMHEFKNEEKIIDVPPLANLRTFNENDILGEVDRDEKGNVVVLKDNTGQQRDKDGNLINPRGYLVDAESGAVVENQNYQQMFSRSELDERGEVPAPFNLEKHNFNPHQIMGDFDYVEGKPELMQSKQGFFMDKKGRRVSKHGWMTLASQGHLVDVQGRKKFDKQQLQNDGDMPKLFNYNGKRFDVKDVMGLFEKDINSRIQPQKTAKGLVDLMGRRVSDKGYLIDAAHNIVDSQQRQIWMKCDLKNGEFPKIFPFTKFNIKRVQGDFEISPSGNPILAKAQQGGFQDRQKRAVNQRGYLIDKLGNVIDNRGQVVFDKVILGKDGEIPSVFRTGLLKQETASDLSDLMNEIEKDHSATDKQRQPGQDGETSMDSQMEDTPANYNQVNHRFNGIEIDKTNETGTQDEEDPEYAGHEGRDSQIEEGTDSVIAGMKNKSKSKKKKPKISTVQILQPTGRDKNMAGAYGGQAVGSVRRPGIKYEKDRLKGSKTFRVNTAEEPKLRAKLTQLVKSASGAHMIDSAGRHTGGKSINEADPQPFAKHGGLMGATVQHNDSIGNEGSRASKGEDNSAVVGKKNVRGKAKPGMQDFEEIFGKDIDQFLEDSEWEMRSQDKVSQGSNPAAQNTKKLKQLEKQYLKAAH